MGLRETIKRILREETELPLSVRRRTSIINKVIDNMLPNMYPCDYNSADHFIVGILDEIIWFLPDFEDLQGIERIHIENYILNYKYDELTDYFNERCIVLEKMNLQESIRRILREELASREVESIESNDELDEYSRTLRNARKQGTKLRFPKSAIESNPLRFRPYSRENLEIKKGEQTEGLYDTSWENDEGDKITLMDLLNATEGIPVSKVDMEVLKPHLLTWDGDEEEKVKIDKSDLQYPILIFVEDDGSFISIIDGHHRAQKAVKNKLRTIKAKVIPINLLPKDIRKVFGHMGRQEEMKEGELTEKCWKGYTQKGMKTMFGKRYPNCVKKTK